jgi:hypothetical protein
LSFSLISFCQEKSHSDAIIILAEELADNDTDPEAVNVFLDQLTDLAENPVKVNRGEPEEISRLFFLTAFQVSALADYVRTEGKIVSYYEIAVIPGFDRETVELIIPYISLDIKQENFHGPLFFRNSMTTNLSVKPGEGDDSCPGSPLKLLTKYRFTAGVFSGGFTAEKDPGERLFPDTPPVTDFLSGYLSFNGRGFVREIIIGDFSARFGQGTNVNTGMRTNLSLATPGSLTGRDDLKPYTSTDENNYFRGAALQLAGKKTGALFYYSRNNIDASTGYNEDSTFSYAASLYRTGLHNSESSILKKDALCITSSGINFTYNFKSVKAGLLYSRSHLSVPLERSIGTPGDLYLFAGSLNEAVTFYYNSQIRKIQLSGEVSKSRGNYFAFVQGISLRPSDRLALNIMYRDYDPGYTTFYGRGPGMGSGTSNEKGVLYNFTFEAARHLFISGGAEIVYFPWLKYRCDFPSMAKRSELRVRYSLREDINLDFSYIFRTSMVNNSEHPGVAEVSEVKTSLVKSQFRYNPGKKLMLTTRLDFKKSYTSGSKGILMAQDITWSFSQIPLTLWFRYCIFKTGDWDSRLYIYENDLLYSFSVPALSGEGNRSYLMVKYRVGSRTDIRFKYGLTTLTGQNGYFENRDEIKLQVRVGF